jgi:hypothetical protein
MTCNTCFGYGFVRDGKPLSEDNFCPDCLGSDICPKCAHIAWLDETNDECTHCGWTWDDPENLTLAQQCIAMKVLIAKLFDEPLPEICDAPFIHDFELGIQVMWDDVPSGEQQCAPLHPNAFNHIFPTSDDPRNYVFREKDAPDEPDLTFTETFQDYPDGYMDEPTIIEVMGTRD